MCVKALEMVLVAIEGGRKQRFAENVVQVSLKKNPSSWNPIFTGGR
jgi:hypothetical protein